MFGGRKEDFNLNGTPGRFKKRIGHKNQNTLPRKGCFLIQQPEHMEWAGKHIAGHRNKKNIASKSDRHKERGLGFDLRIIRLFILSSFIFFLPPPLLPLIFVFLNLCFDAGGKF